MTVRFEFFFISLMYHIHLADVFVQGNTCQTATCLKIPFKCPCIAVVVTMFRIICQEQLQHRICANKTFCAASCISRFEGFIKLLKNETQVSVCCRLLFACLSDPVCLCAVASHHCSVQTELWTAAPPPPQDRQHRTKRNPVWPSAYAEWCHHMHT